MHSTEYPSNYNHVFLNDICFLQCRESMWSLSTFISSSSEIHLDLIIYLRVSAVIYLI